MCHIWLNFRLQYIYNTMDIWSELKFFIWWINSTPKSTKISNQRILMKLQLLYLIQRVIVAVSNLQVASTAWCRQNYFDRGQGTAYRPDRAYRLWGSECHIVSLGKPGRLLWWEQWWWIRRWKEREFSLDILTNIFFYHY